MQTLQQFSGQQQAKLVAGQSVGQCCRVRCCSLPSHSNSPEAVVAARSVQRARTSLCDVADVCCSQTASTAGPVVQSSASYAPWVAAAGGLVLAGLAIKKVYDTPSRSYEGNVGDEYDAWTEEGILEYYWGEHIHLGYYTDEELDKGWWKADFKAAKLRFTQVGFRATQTDMGHTLL